MGLKKKFWFEKIFSPKRIFDSKKFWVWKNLKSVIFCGSEKMLVSENLFWSKKNSGSEKKFGSENILRPKNLWFLKNFWSEKNFGSWKNFGSKENFGSKKKCGSNCWYGQILPGHKLPGRMSPWQLASVKDSQEPTFKV